MDSNFFNLSKRKKRDLLSDLLEGRSTEGIISKKELNALNRLIEGGPANNPPAKISAEPQKTKNGTAAKNKSCKAKRKTTCYLTPETTENLDKALIAIRSQLPENLRSRVTKSEIINQALVVLLQEFAAKGKNSRLVRIIAQET